MFNLCAKTTLTARHFLSNQSFRPLIFVMLQSTYVWQIDISNVSLKLIEPGHGSFSPGDARFAKDTALRQFFWGRGARRFSWQSDSDYHTPCGLGGGCTDADCTFAHSGILRWKRFVALGLLIYQRVGWDDPDTIDNELDNAADDQHADPFPIASNLRIQVNSFHQSFWLHPH